MGCVSFICFILQNDEKLSKRVVVFEFFEGCVNRDSRYELRWYVIKSWGLTEEIKR